MTRVHHGKMRGEKPEELAGLEAPDDEGEWFWPKRNRITRLGKASGPDANISLPCRRRRRRAPSRSTREWRRTYCRGACFPKYSQRKRRDPRLGKEFKGPGGEHIHNYGPQLMTVKTLEGIARQNTWQIADVRRPLVSTSHII